MLITQTDQIQQLSNATFDFVFWRIVQLQRQGDVAKYGAGGEQVKVLEDHANLAASFG